MLNLLRNVKNRLKEDKKKIERLHFQKIFLPLHRLNQSIDFLNLS